MTAATLGWRRPPQQFSCCDGTSWTILRTQIGQRYHLYMMECPHSHRLWKSSVTKQCVFLHISVSFEHKLNESRNCRDSARSFWRPVAQGAQNIEEKKLLKGWQDFAWTVSRCLSIPQNGYGRGGRSLHLVGELPRSIHAYTARRGGNSIGHGDVACALESNAQMFEYIEEDVEMHWRPVIKSQRRNRIRVMIP
jgi:hypothetical protein